jgi:hypothetical protein
VSASTVDNVPCGVWFSHVSCFMYLAGAGLEFVILRLMYCIVEWSGRVVKLKATAEGTFAELRVELFHVLVHKAICIGYMLSS